MAQPVETESACIPDAYGVPTFFATTFFAEPAGENCVRLYACAKINGQIVPQYVAVIPARSMLEAQAVVRMTAIAVMRGDGAGAFH